MKTCIGTIILWVLLMNIVSGCESTPRSGEPLITEPGVVSFSYRHQFSEDVPGTLDMIRDLGIYNIEFSNLFGYPAAEIRQMLDERGMKCTSYGAGYHVVLEEPDQVIADARALGARFVRVGSIPFDRSGPFTIDDARRAVEDFNRAGRLMSEGGLRFLYHNHGYEMRPYGDKTLYDYIIMNTDPEYVNFELDIGWITHPGYDPVEYLKRYPDRFLLSHLKDIAHDVERNYSGRIPREANVRFGTGQVDIPAFLKAAHHSAIEYHFIEYEADDVVEAMPDVMDYLNALTW